MARLPTLFVPLVTLGWVGVWVLWIGAPQPIRAARLWGGPTDGLSRWSGWVEAANEEEVLAGAELSIAVVDRFGKVQRSRPRLDADGRAELSFEFGREPPLHFHAAVHHGERELASGNVTLSRESWLSAARRRGGFLPTRSRGALLVTVAPERGALAVPFESALVVHVQRAGLPVAGVEIRASSDGARVDPDPRPTDSRGFTRLGFTPREHVITLLVDARGPNGDTGQLSTSVPVVPGAFFVDFAELDRTRLRVTAPNERSRAFVTLVSEKGRWFGSSVQLTPTGSGTAAGLLKLPELPKEPMWAVVASEANEPSRARVGWPLFLGGSEPARTLDLRDALLLDGFPKAREDERARRLRARRFALLGGVFGALLSVGSILFRTVKSQRELGRGLRAELDPEALEQVAPRARLRTGGILLLILIGFLVTSLVLAWRLGR